MSGRPPFPMTLLIDECVPRSVAKVFDVRGHTVRFVTDLLLAGAADPLIAVAGDELGAIVVTWNQRDFKSLAARVPAGNVNRFRHLGRISFRMKESRGAHRAAELLERVVFFAGPVPDRDLAAREHPGRSVADVDISDRAPPADDAPAIARRAIS